MLMITGFFFGNVKAQPKNSGVGKFLPDIALPDTSGTIQRLSAQVGKVVLIDFWASWCGPCRKSNPALLKIYQKYQGRDFEIFGVSLDKSLPAWKNAINADNISWLQVNDDGRTNGGTTDWQIMYIPTSFLIDRQGKIVAIDPTVKQLKAYLKKHLK